MSNAMPLADVLGPLLLLLALVCILLVAKKLGEAIEEVLGSKRGKQ